MGGDSFCVFYVCVMGLARGQQELKGVEVERYCRDYGTWRVFLVRVCLISVFCLFFILLHLWVVWLGSHERCNSISE